MCSDWSPELPETKRGNLLVLSILCIFCFAITFVVMVVL